MSSSSSVCSTIFPNDSERPPILSRVRCSTGAELDSISAATIMECRWVERRSCRSRIGGRESSVRGHPSCDDRHKFNSELAQVPRRPLSQTLYSQTAGSQPVQKCNTRNTSYAGPLSLNGIRIHISYEALPCHARSETIAWVRREFERNRHLQDTVSLCMSDHRQCSNILTILGEDQK